MGEEEGKGKVREDCEDEEERCGSKGLALDPCEVENDGIVVHLEED